MAGILVIVREFAPDRPCNGNHPPEGKHGKGHDGEREESGRHHVAGEFDIAHRDDQDENDGNRLEYLAGQARKIDRMVFPILRRRPKCRSDFGRFWRAKVLDRENLRQLPEQQAACGYDKQGQYARRCIGKDVYVFHRLQHCLHGQHEAQPDDYPIGALCSGIGYGDISLAGGGRREQAAAKPHAKHHEYAANQSGSHDGRDPRVHRHDQQCQSAQNQQADDRNHKNGNIAEKGEDDFNTRAAGAGNPPVDRTYQAALRENPCRHEQCGDQQVQQNRHGGNLDFAQQACLGRGFLRRFLRGQMADF